MFKRKNKIQSGNNGTAIWIDETGAVKLRVFSILEYVKETKKIIISFSVNEKYFIKATNIRGKRIIIYQLSDGRIICQNPDDFGNMNLKDQNIKVLRFNLQNTSLQESKAAIYRWTNPLNAVDKLIPLFRLMFICIAIGVIGWAAFKFGGMAFDAVIKSRVMDCSQLLPKISEPTSVVINKTIPTAASI